MSTTLTVDSSLQTTLNTKTTQVDWAAQVATSLGGSLNIRCFRDSNAAAADPFATGIEFLKIPATGGLTATSGAITGFGTLGTPTINLAADLSTGACIMRIEGNGHWIQGKLGLSGNGTYDFYLSANTTGNANTGFGISAGTQIKAPANLGTGVGPTPPIPDNTFPARIVFEDWTNPAAPTTVANIPFDTPDVNLTMTDPEVAISMGDVRVMKSSQSIIFGNFEFGILLLSMNKDCNAEALVPVHEVLINCRPYGTTWAVKYPSYTGYDQANDTTFPNPFKVKIYDGNNTLLYTFQQQDGLPINSPAMAEYRDGTTTLRPHFTCAQMLIWRSHEIKLAKNARKFFNGFTSDILRASTCKGVSWGTSAWVPMGEDAQMDGCLHWNSLPRWPMPWGARNAQDYANASDPYLYDQDVDASRTLRQQGRVSGWDYEPGSISGHDWYTGPGGPRSDRCFVPPALGLYMTKPDGVRLKGNVPFKDMMTAWNKGYFNHPRHYFRDVKSFSTIPVTEAFRNEWMFTKQYYGDGTVSNPDNRIPQFARPNGSSAASNFFDKNGKRPWNGAAVDYMHAYAMPGWGALINNSPAHVVSHKHFAIGNCLAWFGGGRVANPDYTSRFMARQDAWHWGMMMFAWKLASDHPTLGISRAVVEDRMQYYLDAMRTSVMIPCQNGTPGIYFDGIRNLGNPLIDTTLYSAAGNHCASSQSGCSSMSFYMASVFMMMKTTGVWDLLWNKSQNNRDAMTFWIQCYDKYSLDWAIDTDGRYEYYMNATAEVPIGTPLPPIPSSWADWAANVHPKVANENWVIRPDGNPYGGPNHDNIERDSPQHFRAQYAFMRRDFDLYVPNPTKIAAACAKYQGWYDTIEQVVASKTTPRDKAMADWSFRWPGNGFFLPVVTV